ncbi:glycosyltransferase family 2 protein [Dubosiella newyorkensis]|jgi:GT2 family glycosyltransferase|uniref:glycosyltransferase family 2 protein n=3 Tax=Dubosiella newyorkensis TaxID=1862672 RepID=UPI002356372D|nr:glycosyltransferase family 2 protein [Dubosiella newyorkensis]MCI9040886.1 glycosyltransferase family 2 protein [Dubosiella newyorkensis]
MSNIFKSCIDSIEYNDNQFEKNIRLTGWCFFDEGKVAELSILVNKEPIDFEITSIHRPDVLGLYQFHDSFEKIGFVITVPLEHIQFLKKVDVIAHSKNTSETIYSLSHNLLHKYHNRQVFHYSIDDIKNNHGQIVVSGFVYVPTLEHVTIELLNKAGRSVEYTYVPVRRSDVVELYQLDSNDKLIGFQVIFTSVDPKEAYSLKFIYQNDELIIPIIESKSVFSLAKSYIRAANPKRIQNAFNYLTREGFDRFLERLKKGPSQLSDPNGPLSYDEYHEWFNTMAPTSKVLESQKKYHFEFAPKISLIVATYNTDPSFLKAMIDSVINQTYSNWELCIADGSSNNQVEEYIRSHYDDQRIKFKRLHSNLGIAGNMNAALELCTGEYIAFFDHDDLLTPDALFENVKVLQNKNVKFVYSDEDKLISEIGIYKDPRFKPDFNLTLLRTQNYICHFLVVSKSLISRIGAFKSEYDGAQDYDFVLRASEVLKPKEIYHIPKILYHWRMHQASTAANPESKLYAFTAGKRALEDHLMRLRLQATVEMGKSLGIYNVHYEIVGNPLVSIIIPNKDHIDDLDRAIESIQEKSSYRNFEMIIVENNSTDESAFDYYKEIENKYPNVKVVYWKDEFNYSAINNFGFEFSKGDYILLLNNDTEMIEPNSLKSMLGYCQLDEVGAVGAKLLYPDDTIQHAGVIMGLGGIANHAFVNLNRENGGYFNMAFTASEVSAVTAACMMIKRSVFEEVGKLDTDFKVAFNDIDLCMKIRKKNYSIIFDPHALFYHFESKSRGLEDTPEKIERFNGEIERFETKWKDILKNGDPYYNPNFSLRYPGGYYLKSPDEFYANRKEQGGDH